MGAGANKIAGRAGLAALAAGAFAAVPSLAFAAESGGITAILPDMNEFIPMLIAFIILAIVLAKVAWPMIEGILEKRNETVREALRKSEEAQAESERVLAEYKKELADAKSQAQEMMAEAKRSADAVKADIEAKAQAEADAMIEKAKVTIEAEKKAALADLQSSIADISISVAERLVGTDLSDDEHRQIIERYVNEAGNLNAN